MSADAARRRLRALRDDPRTRRFRASTTEVLFGDRTGETLFLASLAFLVLTWRVGTFFNDITLFVPALERLASGHLSLGTPAELTRGYPGMYYADGAVYARNYGELALSLPAYYLVSALGPTLVRALVVLGWSGLLVVLAGRIGAYYGRRRIGLGTGAALGGLALIANALEFQAFSSGQMAVADGVAAAVALQITTMAAGAFTGVLLYRTLARRHGTRVGVLAGAATVLASPVGFWATLPKRHAFTALFVVLALYALARVRERDGAGGRSDDGSDARLGPAGFRAVAYASAGLLTWIHAPEGFTLFLAVAIVDLPHVMRAGRRTVAVAVGALLLSLVPFFLTNYLISGDPLEPPRFLESVGRLEDLPGADAPADGSGGDGAGTDGSGGGSTGSTVGSTGGSEPSDAQWSADGTSGLLFGIRPETFVPERFVTLVQIGLIRYVDGIELALEDLDRLSTIFVRWDESPRSPGSVYFDDRTDLSVLESLPAAAALAVAPLCRGLLLLRRRVGIREWDLDRVDAFAALFSVLILAMFVDRLPVHVMVTVRYLHPLYPLLIYAVCRQKPVRDALARGTGVAVGGYAATVLVGVPLALGSVYFDGGFFPPPPGDVVQPFGRVAHAAAVGVGAALIASAWHDRVSPAAALALAVAAGVVTTYLLSTAFFVFHFGEFALPAVEAAAREFTKAVFP